MSEAVFLTEMETWGITPPDWSATMPESVAPATWARAVVRSKGLNASARIDTKNATLFVVRILENMGTSKSRRHGPRGPMISLPIDWADLLNFVGLQSLLKLAMESTPRPKRLPQKLLQDFVNLDSGCVVFMARRGDVIALELRHQDGRLCAKASGNSAELFVVICILLLIDDGEIVAGDVNPLARGNENTMSGFIKDERRVSVDFT